MHIPLPPASPWQLGTKRAPGRTTVCSGIMLARMLTTHQSTGPTRSVSALSTKMILMFTRVYAGKRQKSQAFVPTWVFVSAYLLIWTLFGLVAYPLALGAERLAGQSMWLLNNAPRIGGALLVVAGLYQLSPLKHMCLAKCRTPLQFILGSS